MQYGFEEPCFPSFFLTSTYHDLNTPFISLQLHPFQLVLNVSHACSNQGNFSLKFSSAGRFTLGEAMLRANRAHYVEKTFSASFLKIKRGGAMPHD